MDDKERLAAIRAWVEREYDPSGYTGINDLDEARAAEASRIFEELLALLNSPD